MLRARHLTVEPKHGGFVVVLELSGERFELGQRHSERGEAEHAADRFARRLAEELEDWVHNVVRKL
jgi:hypothetical protein